MSDAQESQPVLPRMLRQLCVWAGPSMTLVFVAMHVAVGPAALGPFPSDRLGWVPVGEAIDPQPVMLHGAEGDLNEGYRPAEIGWPFAVVQGFKTHSVNVTSWSSYTDVLTFEPLGFFWNVVFFGGPFWIAAWMYVRRRRRKFTQRAQNGLCVDCGYDLRGIVGGRCSECGAASGDSPSRRWLAAADNLTRMLIPIRKLIVFTAMAFVVSMLSTCALRASYFAATDIDPPPNRYTNGDDPVYNRVVVESPVVQFAIFAAGVAYVFAGWVRRYPERRWRRRVMIFGILYLLSALWFLRGCAKAIAFFD